MVSREDLFLNRHAALGRSVLRSVIAVCKLPRLTSHGTITRLDTLPTIIVGGAISEMSIFLPGISIHSFDIDITPSSQSMNMKE